VNLLKTLLTFIAATVLGALGQSLFGITGMLLGSIGGLVFGWWAARRLLPR
jgi:hypothetical protein